MKVRSGKCSRFIPHRGEACGRPARYLIYRGAQSLCKQCYQRFLAGRETLFDPGPGTTAVDRWALQQRLSG